MSEKKKDQNDMAKKVKEAYEPDDASKAKAADASPASSEPDAGASGHEGSDSESSSSRSRGGAGDTQTLIAELDHTAQELEDARQKAGEVQTRYLRAVADLENYRKRAVREKEELSKSVVSDFAEDLFPVIDNFKLGMSAADSHPEAKSFADGMRMVLEQLIDVLKNRGIEEVSPTGEEFDPQWHECVSHLVHDDVPENHVIETIRTGYRLKDRLLRAATVVVSSGKANEGAD